MDYTRSFEVKSKPDYDDLNRIMNLLTVAELREIMCILKKVSIYQYSCGNYLFNSLCNNACMEVSKIYNF